MLVIERGYLRNTTHPTRVTQLPSPHCDARPDVNDISLLVIHCITLPPGEFGGGFIESFFTGNLDYNLHPYFNQIRSLRVSSHVLIDRIGNLTQFVAFTERAWHAGQSEFEGRAACNDYSIGIELEGSDDIAYTEQQYNALAELTCALMASYPKIIPERIVGHSDIAPGRKTDPGLAFEWGRYFSKVRAIPIVLRDAK